MGWYVAGEKLKPCLMHTYLLDNHTDPSREGVVMVVRYLEWYADGDRFYGIAQLRFGCFNTAFPIVDPVPKLASHNAFRGIQRSISQIV